MSDAGTILVVCTGNVCRSPYLHRRLALALAHSGIRVMSAGTGALAGHPMDAAMAGLLGADADADFVARDLAKDEVLAADLVLTATRNHRTLVTRLAPKALRTTFAAADFAALCDALPDAELAALAGAPLPEKVAAVAALRARTTPLAAEAADIVDPYRQAASVYAASAAHIDRIVPSITRVLR